MILLEHIIQNYSYLRSDFINFNVNIYGILLYLLNIIFAFSLVLLFYLVGLTIKKLILKKKIEYEFYISVGLGYIVLGTVLSFLGFFSLLQKTNIIIVLIIAILVAVFSLLRIVKTTNYKTIIPRILASISISSKFIRLTVILFILISVLRLMTPEIIEDGYHTDLPQLYLKSQTTIIQPRDPLRVIPYTQLSEMIYILPILFGDKEVTRFLHFGFYLLIIFLLNEISKKKNYKFSEFSMLLFVTSPLVIRYASSSYIDYFMIYCFLTALVSIESIISLRKIMISGLLLGGMLAIKMWTLVYLPVFMIYMFILQRKYTFTNKLQTACLLSFFALVIPGIWYIRDYLLTGSLLYPIFGHLPYLEKITPVSTPPSSFLGFNWRMFLPANFLIYSPLFFLSLTLVVFNLKKTFLKIITLPLVIFYIILTMLQLMISIYLGRHLLAWYSIGFIVVSSGLYSLYRTSKYFKFIIYSGVAILFMYYFINTIFILPYGFGWADSNKYLTRVLGRDNANYYDFDHRFSKYLTPNDVVATYGLVSYYYANFNYIDVNYIFSQKERSFDLLKKNHVTKLLLKRGDIHWFCETLSLANCNSSKVKLLAVYPDDKVSYILVLYSLK